jgi:hypothetical protein
MKRLVEEIKGYLENTGIPLPSNINTYIQDQAKMILEKMYKQDDEEFNPANVSPASAEGDYYRESIEEYGTVYYDYKERDDDESDDDGTEEDGTEEDGTEEEAHPLGTERRDDDDDDTEDDADEEERSEIESDDDEYDEREK